MQKSFLVIDKKTYPRMIYVNASPQKAKPFQKIKFSWNGVSCSQYQYKITCRGLANTVFKGNWSYDRNLEKMFGVPGEYLLEVKCRNQGVNVYVSQVKSLKFYVEK